VDEHDQLDPDLVPVRTTTSERAVSTTCGACGTELTYGGEGRPRRFCSDSCRTRGWALRRAAEQLGVALPPPVVEIRERLTTRVVAPSGPRVPTDPHGWNVMLAELTAQLADPRTSMHRRHWDHRRVYQSLAAALTALDTAHPGGLDKLRGRR
jgi:hypothetical protein